MSSLEFSGGKPGSALKSFAGFLCGGGCGWRVLLEQIFQAVGIVEVGVPGNHF